MNQFIKVIFMLFLLFFSNLSFTKNIKDNDIWTSRQLLLDGEFSLLETRLAKANDDYLNGKISHRHFLSTNYNFYKRKDLESSKYFNQIRKWIKQFPKSTFALSTMGISLNEYAFFLRGREYARDTEETKLDIFKETNKEALMYILKSIKYSNSNVAAYGGLVDLDKYLNNLSFKNDEILNPIEEFNYSFTDWHAPLLYSFDYSPSRHNPNFHKADILNNMNPELINQSMIWWVYAQGSVPKWGGSYEDMQLVVDASKNYLSDGEHFYLKSSILGEKMSELNQDKKYDEVLGLGESHLNKFYQRGFNIDFIGFSVLSNMTRAASKTDQLDLCIKYAQKAIESRPSIGSYVRSLLGYCNYSKANYKQAEETFKQYEDIVESSDSYGLLYLALINEKLKKIDLAHAIAEYGLVREDRSYDSSFNAIKYRAEKAKPVLKVTNSVDLKEYLKPKPQYF